MSNYTRYRGSCVVEECNGPKQFGGYCIPHARKNGIAPFDIPCKLEFCDRTRETFRTGLCLSHNNSFRRGEELRPLRKRAVRNGRTRLPEGYILVLDKDHPNARKSGYVFEHVKVMTEHLGRPLLPEENVHHINGVRDDNRLENLELWSTSQPRGQRVKDKIEWAREILKIYEMELR